MRKETKSKAPPALMGDYMYVLNECAVVVENHKRKLTSCLQDYGARVKALYKSANAGKKTVSQPDANGYRLINGYRVREIFSGEESLTSLLTRYFERKVSVQY